MKLIFNFFVNRNWLNLTDIRKRAEILADNRKSHHPIETLITEKELEREIKNKGDQFLCKKNMKIL